MVNRVTPSGEVLAPDERVTVEQAVRAFTIGSAYAAMAETIVDGKVVYEC